MTNIKITMLGPNGVGKTSLMAALYNCVDRVLAETKLKFTPHSNTKSGLDARLQELKELSEQNLFKVDRGGSGTADCRSYAFNLSKQESDKSSIQFVFQDYPGGYHRSNQDYLKKSLLESSAVLLTIDAAAMIEEKGKWHNFINQPREILELFKEIYPDLTEPKMVILAPIKCEAYINDEKNPQSLSKITEEKYTELIHFFRSAELKNKVNCVIAPVQTVGSVIFSYIQEVDEEPQFFYRKRNSSTNDYNPQGGEILLQYLLRFVLEIYLNQSRWKFGLDWLKNILDRDREFKDAIEKLANSIRDEQKEPIHSK